MTAGIVVWPRSVIVDFNGFITFHNALYLKNAETISFLIPALVRVLDAPVTERLVFLAMSS
jgi:hypothetical protein